MDTRNLRRLIGGAGLFVATLGAPELARADSITFGAGPDRTVEQFFLLAQDGAFISIDGDQFDVPVDGTLGIEDDGQAVVNIAINGTHLRGHVVGKVATKERDPLVTVENEGADAFWTAFMNPSAMPEANNAVMADIEVVAGQGEVTGWHGWVVVMSGYYDPGQGPATGFASGEAGARFVGGEEAEALRLSAAVGVVYMNAAGASEAGLYVEVAASDGPVSLKVRASRMADDPWEITPLVNIKK